MKWIIGRGLLLQVLVENTLGKMSTGNGKGRRWGSYSQSGSTKFEILDENNECLVTGV